MDACREEIGGTMLEYIKKLGKKAEKLPFPQRMWMADGYSEEEIEKLLKEEDIQRRWAEKEG